MSPNREVMIETIRQFPDVLTQTISGLSKEQLMHCSPIDPWTIQQIVHHMADSHINGIVRLKQILTVDKPTLQGYDENTWVQLPDVQQVPIESTLLILRGLHTRWCAVWESLTEEQWQRVGIHTEYGPMTVDQLLVMYSKHCDDHLEQIKHIMSALPM